MSEQIMQDILQHRITLQEATAFLANVIRTEKAKIEALKLLQRVDSLNPENDALHDDARRRAWEFVSSRGVNARPPEPTQSDPHETRITKDIALVQDELRHPSTQNRIFEVFREQIGRSPDNALERMRVLDLYIQGKSAAWNADADALTEIQTLAETLAAEPLSMFGTPRPDLSSNTNSAPSHAPTTQIRPGGGDDRSGGTDNEAPVIVRPAEPPTPDPEQGKSTPRIPDPRIAAVVQRMNEQKRSEGIEEKTLRQYESFSTLFTAITRVTDIRDVRQTHAAEFRAALHKIPKSWGKSPNDSTMSFEAMRAKAQGLASDKVGLSTPTINRHLEHLDQIAKWADDEGIPIDPKLRPNKLRRKDIRRDQEKKASFKENDLRTFFQTPVWMGSKSERFQTEPGRTIFKNGLYWCPIIAAYSGGRREEIAGLSVSDIKEHDGIHFFELRFTEVRRVKNIVSIRQIPIHSRIIELGFLDFVEAARQRGQIDLFPTLREPKSGQHGKKLGRRMRQIIDGALGEGGKDLSFHSIRHYVQDFFDRDPRVPDKVCRDIMGHEGKDTHERSYGDRTPLSDLKEAIELLPIVF